MSITSPKVSSALHQPLHVLSSLSSTNPSQDWVSPLDNATRDFQAPFPAINLPRELRNKIYRELLVPEKIRDPKDQVPKYNLEPAILRVNRQINAEAAIVLYRENCWILFEIHSAEVADKVLNREACRIFTANLDNFLALPALKVRIQGLVDNTDERVYVHHCDFNRFFEGVVSVATRNPFDLTHEIGGWAPFDFELDIYGCKRGEEEDLLDLFQEVRGVSRASVKGTAVLSSGRKLATLMTKTIERVDEVFERAKVYQARGDGRAAALEFREAKDAYGRGCKYLQSVRIAVRKLQGDIAANKRRFEYKYLSMWFSGALCNFKLGIPRRSDPDELIYHYDSTYKREGLYAQIIEILDRRKVGEAMETVLSDLNRRRVDQQSNREIEHVEAQLHTLFELMSSVPERVSNDTRACL